jgi:hypothetical protein
VQADFFCALNLPVYWQRFAFNICGVVVLLGLHETSSTRFPSALVRQYLRYFALPNFAFVFTVHVFLLLRYVQIVVGLLCRCSLLCLLKTHHKRGLFLPLICASNRRVCRNPNLALVGLLSFLSGAAVCIQRAAAPVVFRTARRVKFQTMLFIVVLLSVQHSLGEIAPPVGCFDAGNTVGL